MIGKFIKCPNVDGTVVEELDNRQSYQSEVDYERIDITKIHTWLLTPSVMSLNLTLQNLALTPTTNLDVLFRTISHTSCK